MGGTAGKPSFGVVVAESEPAAGEFKVIAAGGGDIGAGEVDGQAGALLSAASDVPLVLVKGGTPSADWLKVLVPARGAGPSLIFTYKYAPTTASIVIVTSGRIEPIDRPP
jgi:hypothetical protein